MYEKNSISTCIKKNISTGIHNVYIIMKANLAIFV